MMNLSLRDPLLEEIKLEGDIQRPALYEGVL